MRAAPTRCTPKAICPRPAGAAPGRAGRPGSRSRASPPLPASAAPRSLALGAGPPASHQLTKQPRHSPPTPVTPQGPAPEPD